MTRFLLLFVTTIAFAAAPTNQLTIVEKDGTAQANRPTRFGRPFARGEIWGHPQPVVNGTPATSWQATVKTRHRDGVGSCPVTGATNEYPITITCADHGYRNGDWVTLAGVGGNTAANGYHRIIRRSRDQFFLQGVTGNGAYTTGGTATGPSVSNGSVRHAIIVLDDDVDLVADGALTITFRDVDNACHLGNRATCEAAALTEAQMLDWSSSGWGAGIQVTQSNTYTANARTMVDAADFEYWVAGPILTEVIVRDRTSARSHDFGWTCLANCTGDYSAAIWQTDATNRSLHPIFVLSFYDALPNSVRVGYTLENAWYGHFQDQSYALTLKSSSDLSVSEYSKAEFAHYARTRWRKVFWDGAEPGSINIDHTEAYLEFTGAAPVWMDDVEPQQVDIDFDAAAACAANADINDNHCFAKYFPTSGGRPEIGVFPRWEAVWLQTFDESLWPMVWDGGNVSGHIPIHIRDADETAIYYVDVDGSGTTDAGDNVAGNGPFGRPYSIDAHPTSTCNAGSVATLSSSHGWTPDAAHQAAFAYVPYLVTGDYYFLEEMQFWSARNLCTLDPSNHYSSRGRNYGILHEQIQTRGLAWAFRNLAHAAWATPDHQTEEKEYFTNKVHNNLMYQYGKFSANDVSGASYLPLIGGSDDDPCGNVNWNGGPWTQKNPYCYGSYFGTEWNKYTYNPLGIPSLGSAAVGCGDSWTTGETADLCDATWMQDYMYLAIGRAGDLGYPVKDYLRHAGKWRIAMVHPDHNPYLAATYRKILARDADTFATTPKHAMEFWNAAGDAKSTWEDREVFWRANYGWSFIFGSLPYLQDSVVGSVEWRDAWDWYTNPSNVTNVGVRCVGGSGSCDSTHIESNWNIGPRFEPTRLQYGVPGANALLLHYVAPSERSCTVDVDDSPSFGSPVASLADGGGGRDREPLIGGLSGGQEYFYRVTCLDDVNGQPPLTGSMTTLNAGAATQVQLRPTPPPAQAITDVRVRSGLAEGALNTDSGAVPCGTGCVVSIAATEGVPVFYQLEYLSGGGSVSTGRVEVAVP